ncbi:hypothetical protein [uncultured Methanobrevibacter sp.]|nr:hypothetical protein [uncultured Methanobrevibacter sp.]
MFALTLKHHIHESSKPLQGQPPEHYIHDVSGFIRTPPEID